jgi:putative outer membrane protein, probably involved in nutrient binding
MKKYILIATLALSAGVSALLTSCEDTLDADKYFDDRRTIESVFTDINQTNGWLAESFKYLSGICADVTTKDGNSAGYHNFADDMFWGDRDNFYDSGYSVQVGYNAFKQADYSETYGQDFWTNCYNGIRQASIFIQNVWMCTPLTEEQRADLKGQARFVRAYYYFLLLRRYGPVPIIPDEGVDYTKDYESLSFPRNTYDEVVNYISNEMITACGELQDWSRTTGNMAAENMVRPTRGAALAVRAYALMFGASPLANGQLKNGEHPGGVSDGFVHSLRNNDGTYLLSTEYDEGKWARAAAALRDVMECPAGYALYYQTVNSDADETNGRPATITPYKDGDFSEKNWPEGYADIDPYLSYRDYFTGYVALDNTEIIFSRGYNTGSRHQSIDGLITHAMPTSLNGWNCHAMTQKMCDAYYMYDGTDCPGKDSEYGEGDGSDRLTGFTSANRRDPNYYKNFRNSAYLKQNVSMQYVNREPRFYASVGFNGASWWNKRPNYEPYVQVFYYRGTAASSSSEEGGATTTSNNGYSATSGYWNRTGIGIKKYINPEDYRERLDAGDYGHIHQHWEPAIRYADILLLYAEAINELTGSYTVPNWNNTESYAISRSVTELKRGIRPVRCRAGVPDLDHVTAEGKGNAGIYSDRNALRKAIKRERMIELFAESKRYYDLRRWMDAPVEEAKTIYGCNVLMTEQQREEFHQVVPVYSLPTIFNDKMWFWPISTNELKRNKNLVQNPGWQYYD